MKYSWLTVVAALILVGCCNKQTCESTPSEQNVAVAELDSIAFNLQDSAYVVCDSAQYYEDEQMSVLYKVNNSAHNDTIFYN